MIVRGAIKFPKKKRTPRYYATRAARSAYTNMRLAMQKIDVPMYAVYVTTHAEKFGVSYKDFKKMIEARIPIPPALEERVAFILDLPIEQLYE